MTTYSEWVIIPKDRKCDLPPDAKVQVMCSYECVFDAEKNLDKLIGVYLDNEGKWKTSMFAYRVVQEPVEEVREYEMAFAFFKCGIPSIWHEPPERRTDAVRGTATQTTRDGKPYRFVWEAASE